MSSGNGERDTFQQNIMQQEVLLFVGECIDWFPHQHTTVIHWLLDDCILILLFPTSIVYYYLVMMTTAILPASSWSAPNLVTKLMLS